MRLVFFLIIPQTELYWFQPHKEHFISVTSLELEPLVTCAPGLTCSVAWTPAWTLYSKTSESEYLFPELLHQLGFRL